MENNSGKGLSHIPLIMMALVLYVGYKTFFLDHNPHKVYVINASSDTELTTATNHIYPGSFTTPDSSKPSKITNNFKESIVTKVVQNRRLALADQSALAFAPVVAPKDEVVKGLLEKGENIKKIARQTGLQKKEIRKIKRKKRTEEKRDKKQRNKLFTLILKG